MAQLSNDLVYAAMAVYAAAMVAYAGALAMTREVLVPRTIPVSSAAAPASVASSGTTAVLEKDAPASARATPSPRAEAWSRSAVAVTIVAAALHVGAVAARGIAAGRPPWGNMYEFAVAAGLAAILVYLFALTRWPVRDAGVVIVPAVLLVLGIAVVKLYTEAEQLVPALRSYWLAIHVLAAIVAIGGFTLGAALSVLHLVVSRAQERAAAGRAMGPRMAALPSSERLDRAAYRVHAFTFPLWTFAVLAGAVWAQNAWGRSWNWDPKETWAFITWVLYAGYLHARATIGWRGRRADMLALIGYASIIFNFTIINLYGTGLHTYSGVK